MEMSEILARAKAANQEQKNIGINRDDLLICVPEIIEILPDLIAECDFWRQKAIEERAKRITNICEPDKFGTWPRLEKIVYEEAETQLERELDMTDHNQQAERELDSEHEHVWVNMAPNIHMTCSICGKTK